MQSVNIWLLSIIINMVKFTVVPRQYNGFLGVPQDCQDEQHYYYPQSIGYGLRGRRKYTR